MNKRRTCKIHGHEQIELLTITVNTIPILYCPTCWPQPKVKKSDINKHFDGYCLCMFCGELTTMLGTQMCDRCWEISHRIQGEQEGIIRRIMREHGYVIRKKFDDILLTGRIE